MFAKDLEAVTDIQNDLRADRGLPDRLDRAAKLIARAGLHRDRSQQLMGARLKSPTSARNCVISR